MFLKEAWAVAARTAAEAAAYFIFGLEGFSLWS